MKLGFYTVSTGNRTPGRLVVVHYTTAKNPIFKDIKLHIITWSDCGSTHTHVTRSNQSVSRRVLFLCRMSSCFRRSCRKNDSLSFSLKKRRQYCDIMYSSPNYITIYLNVALWGWEHRHRLFISPFIIHRCGFHFRSTNWSRWQTPFIGFRVNL